MNHPTTTSVSFTVDQYKRMIDVGIFAGRTGRIELIEGELRMMSPASDGHDEAILSLTEWSHRVIGSNFRVAVQIGLQLLHSESMPEPDLYWIEASHRRGRPTSKIVPFVIEVAASSLETDLITKHHLYAEEKIPEYWVVDTGSETIVVHRNPSGKRYGNIETFNMGQAVSPLCMPAAILDLKWLFRE